jgi:hypothetical protein
VCGEKYTKHAFLNERGHGDRAMYAMQASTFIDFWIKSMKIHQPNACDEESLEALRESIDQRQSQIKLKRMRLEERDKSVETTADTPPGKIRKIDAATSTSVPIVDTMMTEMDEVSSEQDGSGEDEVSASEAGEFLTFGYGANDPDDQGRCWDNHIWKFLRGE